jgi:hypothetical protein
MYDQMIVNDWNVGEDGLTLEEDGDGLMVVDEGLTMEEDDGLLVASVDNDLVVEGDDDLEEGGDLI